MNELLGGIWQSYQWSRHSFFTTEILCLLNNYMSHTNLAKIKKSAENFKNVFVLTERLEDEKRAYNAKKRKEREELVDWMKERCPEVRYFLSLTFSYEPTKAEAERSAKIFQHEVSRAIAGKRATTYGRYSHPMGIVLEQQVSERFHLHVMMEALPTNYNRITDVDDLKIKCAKTWSKLRYRNKPSEQFLLFEQRKNPVDDLSAKIAGEHSNKWFQELITYCDIDKCFEYITKTYKQQNSDMLVV